MGWLVFISMLVHTALAGNLYSPPVYGSVGVVQYAPSPLRTSVGYGPLAAARLGLAYGATPIAAHAPVATPLVATAGYSYAPAPVAPVVTNYAAVPAVADVPVTRYHAQPGYIQRYVDVAHQKYATSKIQIRRPAIQKHFYDIEERVLVRPVGSAVLELDQPISRQHGPTVVSPGVHPVAVAPSGPALPPPPPPPPGAYPPSAPSPSGPSGPEAPPSAPEAPSLGPYPPARPPSSQPPPPNFPPQEPSPPNFPVSNPSQDDVDFDDDTIAVDVPSRSGAGSSRQQPLQQQEINRQTPPPPASAFQRSGGAPDEEDEELPQPRSVPRNPPSPTPAPFPSVPQTQVRFLNREPTLPQPFNRNLVPQSIPRTFGPDVIPSSRSLSPEDNQNNQQRLIELLTGRGGVAEVRSGVSIESLGEAGQVRARVLSVTPAPPSSSPDERVSTRRVVVSRPIQTLQEVDLVQPFTKLQRVAVHQPTLFKTASVGIARVKTLAPVPVASYAAHPHYATSPYANYLH